MSASNGAELRDRLLRLCAKVERADDAKARAGAEAKLRQVLTDLTPKTLRGIWAQVLETASMDTAALTWLRQVWRCVDPASRSGKEIQWDLVNLLIAHAIGGTVDAHVTEQCVSFLRNSLHVLPSKTMVYVVGKVLRVLDHADAGDSAGAVLELLPKCWSLLPNDKTFTQKQSKTGAAFKAEWLDTLLQRQWPVQCVTRMLSVLRDLPLSDPASWEAVATHAVQHLSQCDLTGLPSAVYQVLLLSERGHKALILHGITEHVDALGRSAPSPDAERRVRQVEGTIALSVDVAVRHDAALGLEWLKLVERDVSSLGPSVFTPFIIGALLAMARIPRFADRVMKIIMSALVASYRRSGHTMDLPWLAAARRRRPRRRRREPVGDDDRMGQEGREGVILDDDEEEEEEEEEEMEEDSEDDNDKGVPDDDDDAATKRVTDSAHVPTVLMETVRRAAYGWDHVLPSLVDLGMKMVSSSPGFAEAADVKHAKARIVDLGVLLLARIFESHEVVQAKLLEEVLARVLSQTRSTPHFVRLLADMVRLHPHLILVHMYKIRETMDYLLYLAPDVSQAVVKAMIPLMRLEASFKDQVLIVLRKAMFSGDVNARLTAVSGFLHLVQVFSREEPRNAADAVSLSQVEPLPAASTKAFQEEVLGLLRRCLRQQAQVRAHFYAELPGLVHYNAAARDFACRVLLNHFMEYYNDDGAANEPLHLDACIEGSDVDVTLVEPLDEQVSCMSLCLLSCDTTQLQPAAKIVHRLEVLVRRLMDTELEDWCLDESVALDHSRAGREAYTKACLLANTLLAVMEHVVLQLHGGALSAGDAALIVKLWRDHGDVVARLRAAESNGGKKAAKKKQQPRAGRRRSSGSGGGEGSFEPRRLHCLALSSLLARLCNDGQEVESREGVALLQQLPAFGDFVWSQCVSHLRAEAATLAPRGAASRQRDVRQRNASLFALEVVRLATTQWMAPDPELGVCSDDEGAVAARRQLLARAMECAMAHVAADTMVDTPAVLEHLARAIGTHVEEPDPSLASCARLSWLGAQLAATVHAPLAAERWSTAASLVTVLHHVYALVTDADARLQAARHHVLSLCRCCVTQGALAASLLSLLLDLCGAEALARLQEVVLGVHQGLGDVDAPFASQQLPSQDSQGGVANGGVVSLQVQPGPRVLGIVGTKTVVRVMAELMHRVEAHVDEVGWAVAQAKPLAMLREPSDVWKVRPMKAAIAERSTRLAQVMTVLCRCRLSKAMAVPLMKLVIKFYKIVAAFIQPMVRAKEIPDDAMMGLAEAIGSERGNGHHALSPSVHELLSFLQEVPLYGSKPTKALLKREAKMKPDLVFALEQVESLCIKLGKKTEVNLVRNWKQSTIRDFRLGAGLQVHAQALQQQQQQGQQAPTGGETPPTGVLGQQGAGGGRRRYVPPSASKPQARKRTHKAAAKKASRKRVTTTANPATPVSQVIDDDDDGDDEEEQEQEEQEERVVYDDNDGDVANVVPLSTSGGPSPPKRVRRRR